MAIEDPLVSLEERRARKCQACEPSSQREREPTHDEELPWQASRLGQGRGCPKPTASDQSQGEAHGAQDEKYEQRGQIVEIWSKHPRQVHERTPSFTKGKEQDYCRYAADEGKDYHQGAGPGEWWQLPGQAGPKWQALIAAKALGLDKQVPKLL